MYFVIVLLFIIALMCNHCQQAFLQLPDNEDETNEVEIIQVDAVLSRNAALPCNTKSFISNDQINTVFWYKDGYNTPIYSFDVRNRPFAKATQWSDSKVFGPRAYFVTLSNPSSLTVDNVQLDDEGIYHCRVDFQISAAREISVNLTVIIPLHQLTIYDNSGHDVANVIGPLREGSDLILTCEVRGGKPNPKLSWFHNNRLVDGNMDNIGNHIIVSRLTIINLTRDYLNSTFKCQASNTRLILPTEKTVRLDMWFKPLNVVISGKLEELVAGKIVTIACEVYGSRPKAVITWMQNNKSFERGNVTDENTNDTRSLNSLNFTPLPQDDGTILKCIGKNPKLSDASQEDSFKLNVVYSPIVAVHFGTSLNSDHIKEGDDVYFECNIKANPKEHKFFWYHNGEIVNQNISSGIIISMYSLVLQSITRWQGGIYSCLAVNTLGETMSEPINLRVRYVPICKKNSEVSIIGATLNENLTIDCQVLADPFDLTFLWQFNNGGESFDIQPLSRFTATSGNVNQLIYPIKSHRDYGTLTCWASNLIGRQIDPCIFQIIPASQPAPVSNCTIRTIYNQTNDVVDIECKAGYDGGLPQIFILEAFDAQTMQLRINQTVVDMENPLFHLNLEDILPNSLALKMAIYAENAKGKSDKFLLDDILINNAKKQTDGSNNMNFIPITGLLTGSLLTLGIVVVVILIISVQKKKNYNNTNHFSHHVTLNESKPSLNLQTSMLEINTDDNRYVVAYTVKPITVYSTFNSSSVDHADSAIEKQPDILKTSPDETNISTNLLEYSQSNDLLNSCANYAEDNQINIDSPQYQNSYYYEFNSLLEREPIAYRQVTTDRLYDNPFPSIMRREHIITDSIPGPESCV